MRRIVLIILMISLLTSLCFSIPKPKQGMGSIIGKTYLEYDKDIEEMKAGKYYKVMVYMISKNTRKKYSTMANKDGIFYFLNLQPGEYVLAYSRYKYQAGNTIFYLNGYFGKNGVALKIDSNKITAVKTIGAFNEVLPFNEKTDKKGAYESILRTKKSVVREENIDELKAFFKKIDRRNQWNDFEWQ